MSEWRKRALAAEAALERREQGTYCAYCGFEVACDDDAGAKISEHIGTCEKHPMRRLEAEVGRLKAALVRYGRHGDECRRKRTGLEEDCDCGFLAALEGPKPGCPTCGGSGSYFGTRMDCPHCEGSGEEVRGE